MEERCDLKSLLDVLALVDPLAFGRAQRLERFVHRIAVEATLEPSWPIEAAALLSQLGCLELSDVVMMKLYGGEALEAVEQSEVHTAYGNVCVLLASIPRLEPAIEIIGALSTSPGPIGAQVVRIAMEFDALVARGFSREDATVIMKTWGARYDYDILQAAIRASSHAQAWRAPRELSIDELFCGVFVAEDIRKHDGVLIVPRGVELSNSVIAHIQRFRGELAKGTVRVTDRAEDEETQELPAVDAAPLKLSATG